MSLRSLTSSNTPHYSPPHSKDQVIFSPCFLRVLAVQMAFGVSFSAFLLLPKFLRVELGANATEIGWIAGVSLLVAAAFSPFIGFLAKRFDRRRLLALALLLEGGAALLFVFVTEIGPLAYSLRIAQGLAFVLIFNCTTTIAADILPPQHLAKGVGYLGVSMLATNALAPLINEPLAARYGWSLTFVAAGAVALAALFLLPGLNAPRTQVSRHALKSPAQAPLLSIHYASFLMGAGLGSMFTFVQPFALQQGAKDVGSFFLGYALAALTARVGFGGLTDKKGATKVATAGLALYAAVASCTFLLTPNLLPLFGVGLGLAHGFLYPALAAAGLGATRIESRPVFMGWFASAFNAGYAVAVLLLGPLADSAGFAPIFLLLGAAIATGLLPLLRFHRRALTPLSTDR